MFCEFDDGSKYIVKVSMLLSLYLAIENLTGGFMVHPLTLSGECLTLNVK
jgi:hypothetical protein